MATYDIYRGGPAYLVDVQSEFLDHLRTRMVIPLLETAQVPDPLARLHLEIVLDGKRYLLATQLMTAVPAALLSEKVATCVDRATDITDAIDFLLHGY